MNEELKKTPYYSEPMMVPNAWPFGKGALLTAVGEADALGYYWIAAAPDGYQESDGKTAQESWDKWKELKGPHLLLHFPKAKDLDVIIDDLLYIREKLWEVENYDSTNSTES